MERTDAFGQAMSMMETNFKFTQQLLHENRELQHRCNVAEEGMASFESETERLTKLMDEVYTLRGLYMAAWLNQKHTNVEAYKSRLHHDGTIPFNDPNYFLVEVSLLDMNDNVTVITNHYKMELWNYFDIEETEKAVFEFDGHTNEQTVERMKAWLS